MSAPHDNRSSSRRNGTWSPWVPLAVTATVAAVGIAAWVWSQQDDDNDHDDELVQDELDYENADYGDNPPYGATDGADSRLPPRSSSRDRALPNSDHDTHDQQHPTSGGWGAKMSGALRRTPSPQQLWNNASRSVAAGVASVGATVGHALASIQEEDKPAYADHERWPEEAAAKDARKQSARKKTKRRKVVAVVVSADNRLDGIDPDDFHEHASILSHIPKHNDFGDIILFILIYAPGLRESFDATPSILPPASLSSSFSNIGHEQARSSHDDNKSPRTSLSGTNPAFNAVYSQALGLVEKEAMILPFTTPQGHVHLLRQLQPDLVYLQESLSGDNGQAVSQIQSWLRNDLVLVVGAERGHGGLVDSDSETERTEKDEKWWHREERVGRGRGVVIVDGLRVHDDWARRVQGRA